jgi:hypothetical protein
MDTDFFESRKMESAKFADHCADREAELRDSKGVDSFPPKLTEPGTQEGNFSRYRDCCGGHEPTKCNEMKRQITLMAMLVSVAFSASLAAPGWVFDG